jgi:hypothetical protein
LLARTTWPHTRIKAVLRSTRSTSSGATARPIDAASRHEPPASSSATHAELFSDTPSSSRLAEPTHDPLPSTMGDHAQADTRPGDLASSPACSSPQPRRSRTPLTGARHAALTAPPAASLSRPSSDTKCWIRPRTHVPTTPPSMLSLRLSQIPATRGRRR